MKILIIVLSSDFPPYDKMIQTSFETWDSVEVPGVETVFVCGTSKKPDTDKIIYLNVGNGLFDMGKKTLGSFEWALKKEFDFVARVNASCYVDKKKLFEYCQTLEHENVFAGSEAESVHGFMYMWGGTHYIISRDVVQKIVGNKHIWDHKFIEDESISILVRGLGIPFTQGYSGAIDKIGDGWRIISYGGESISFKDFSELKRLNHHFYRVKHDGDRSIDEFVMKKLFEVL